MESKLLQEDGNLMTFTGVIGRKKYFINFALLMAGFILVGLLFALGFYQDHKLPVEKQPSTQSLWMYLVAITAALPLLYMSWINKFKRIRDIRGTQKQEKLWFGLWILLGLIPYSGILMSVGLGLFKGKITNSSNK